MTEQPTLRRQRAPYAETPEWVLYSRTLTPAAKTLYAVLDRFAGQDRACFPGRQTLADRVGVSIRTLDAALDQLIAAGAVIVRHRWINGDGHVDYQPYGSREPVSGHRQTSNDYYVCEWPYGAAGPSAPVTRGGAESARGEGAESAPTGAQDLRPKESHKKEPPPTSPSSDPETYGDDHERVAAQPRPAPVLVPTYDEAMDAIDARTRAAIDEHPEEHIDGWARLSFNLERPARELAEERFEHLRHVLPSPAEEGPPMIARYVRWSRARSYPRAAAAMVEEERPGVERRRAVNDPWLDRLAAHIDRVRSDAGVPA